MFQVGKDVEAASHHLAILHNHRADHRVRTRLPTTLPRQFQSYLHPRRIVHAGPELFATGAGAPNRESMKRSGSKGSRSSTFSPTPMKRMGSDSSRAMATTMPPFAVPSSLVNTIP